MKTYETAHEAVGSMPVTVGQVHFASGEAIVKDTGICRISESSQKLFKTNGMPTVPRLQEHSQHGLNASVKALASQPLDSFRKVTGAWRFLKSGRSTAVTTGICNGFLATYNQSKEDRRWFDSQRDQAEMQPAYMEEFFIFFSKRAYAGQHEKSEFSGLLYGALL
ncbi:hypothetical protein FQN50_000628 [Emmonsiellopsis sp. PD_5]|nr:hypothetical protein FQN50_000628 [Emmonsiellopsis sp. PD_5]